MSFVAFLLFLHRVAGTPPLRDSFNDKPHEVDLLPHSSTSSVSLLMPPATNSQNLSSFPSPPASQSDHPLALIASATPQLVHHRTAAHLIPSAITNLRSLSTSIVPEAPSETHLPLGTSLHTEGSTTQQSHLTLSSSVASDTVVTVTSQPSALPSVTSATNTTTPKIRFALIGVLAGVPALTVLGFFITMRWRRTSVSRKVGMKKISPDCADLGFNNKERKGARFSSFFGVNNTGAVPSKNMDGRKLCRAVYASSIHSTAGLAGVGAHRGASANSVPPMIHYKNVAEIGLDGEFEKKANFDNPFGTPPPVCAGFITAPSRVSPHLPHTPPQLINLPPLPTAIHRDEHPDQLGSTGLAISHPIAIPSQNSASRYASHFQNRGHNEKHWEGVKDPIPVHVRSQQPHSSPRLLSPDMADDIHTRSRNLKHPIPSNSQHNPAQDVRISVAPSIYGGLASPGGLAPKKQPLDPIPVVLYPNPSPKPDSTPVLPYLSSPISGPGRPEDHRQGAGPVIVIEIASPTIDSESEYADTDGGDAAGGRYVDEGSANCRRTGLIGSPHGFVAPSSTFSSVSLYSISRSAGSSTSSSTSTIIPRESSASSAFALSSSSSGASSVVVKAAMVDPVRKTRMRDPHPGESAGVNRSVVSWSRLPRDINKLDRDGLRGIAF